MDPWHPFNLLIQLSLLYGLDSPSLLASLISPNDIQSKCLLRALLRKLGGDRGMHMPEFSEAFYIPGLISGSLSYI